MLCKKLRMTVCRAEAALFLSGGLISYKQNKNNNNCSVLPLDLLLLPAMKYQVQVRVRHCGTRCPLIFTMTYEVGAVDTPCYTRQTRGSENSTGQYLGQQTPWSMRLQSPNF